MLPIFKKAYSIASLASFEQVQVYRQMIASSEKLIPWFKKKEKKKLAEFPQEYWEIQLQYGYKNLIVYVHDGSGHHFNSFEHQLFFD